MQYLKELFAYNAKFADEVINRWRISRAKNSSSRRYHRGVRSGILPCT